MRSSRLIFPFVVCLIGFGFSKFNLNDHWKQLYNGKDLTGWDTYIGPDINDSGKFITGQPLGLNNDPRHVFTIVNQDGKT